MKQYDVDIIESMVKNGSQDGCNITWWANNPKRKKNNDGTFTMFNCEKEPDGSFTAVGFQPVHIPKECVARFIETKYLCL